MHIITAARLKEFYANYPDAESSLTSWNKITSSAQWSSFVELRQSYPAADLVENLTVFNIGGNKYRLITFIDYKFKKVFIRYILTHKEYDTEKWKNDSWCR